MLDQYCALKIFFDVDCDEDDQNDDHDVRNQHPIKKTLMTY